MAKLYNECDTTSPSMDRIRQLVNANPSAVRFRFGELKEIPLYAACRAVKNGGGPQQLALVQYLVEQWLESVKTVNSHGDLPLHVACCSKAPLEVIQFLVEQWPQSVKTVNNNGSLPLHLARCFKTTPPAAVVQYLVEQWPESVKTTTNYRYLPLHTACAYSAPLEVVQCLVQQWPESVKHRNYHGETPLDMVAGIYGGDIVVKKWLKLPWRDRFN
jgi:ankyrin repeat protein